jgi:RNA polymerase sigma-70 factor (ECF subfamily)
LPGDKRETLELHYWKGRPMAEVAAHLGRSTAAVAGLLKQGLKQLRSQLHEQE